MAEVIPSIFEKDFATIEQKVHLVAARVQRVHIDFADNTLVPTQSFFDCEKFTSLIKQFPQVSFEAHLMVAAPEKYLQPLISAGFRKIIIHVESNDPRLFLTEAKKEIVDVAIAIDSPTEIEQLEPFLDEVETVLVMCVEAGVSGQQLLPEAVEKIKMLRSQNLDLHIEAEGGITVENSQQLISLGASGLVINHSLYHDAEGIEQVISSINNI